MITESPREQRNKAGVGETCRSNKLQWRENVKRCQRAGGEAASVTRAPIKPSLYSLHKISVLLSDNDKGYRPINHASDASSNCQRERLGEREGEKSILGDCEMRDGGDTCMITFCSVPVPSRSYSQSALRGDGDVLESQVHGGRC